MRAYEHQLQGRGVTSRAAGSILLGWLLLKAQGEARFEVPSSR